MHSVAQIDMITLRGLKMSIDVIIQWFLAIITAAITIVVFAYKNFVTKENLSNLEFRLAKSETKLEKMEEKIERKLEIISDKLDKVLFLHKD